MGGTPALGKFHEYNYYFIIFMEFSMGGGWGLGGGYLPSVKIINFLKKKNETCIGLKHGGKINKIMTPPPPPHTHTQRP